MRRRLGILAATALVLAGCGGDGINAEPTAGPPDWDTELEAINSKIIQTYRELGEIGCAGATGIRDVCAEPLREYTDVVLEGIEGFEALSAAHGDEPPTERVQHYDAIVQAIAEVEIAVADRKAECSADEASVSCANLRLRALNAGTAFRWALQDWYAPIG